MEGYTSLRFHKNICICVLNMNGILMGLEWHETANDDRINIFGWTVPLIFNLWLILLQLGSSQWLCGNWRPTWHNGRVPDGKEKHLLLWLYQRTVYFWCRKFKPTVFLTTFWPSCNVADDAVSYFLFCFKLTDTYSI